MNPLIPNDVYFVKNTQLKTINNQSLIGSGDISLDYADGAEYDSTNKLIYLKHGSTRLSNPIDATAFIKDGMVDTVEVTGGNLVITFNTDSGK